MYIIVVGAGAIGSQVVDLTIRADHEIAVIEKDPRRAETVSRLYDCLVLNANATNRTTLIDAGADQADAIICTTDDDTTNTIALLLARDIEIPSLVTVARNPEHFPILTQIGANILENPPRRIAESLVRSVQRPTVKGFMQLADNAEVLEIAVVGDAPIVDLTLEEAKASGIIGDDMLVVAINRDETIITPKEDTTIHAGDHVTLFSRNGLTPEVMQEFTDDLATR